MPGISTALRGTALLVSFYYAGLRALDRLPLLLRSSPRMRPVAVAARPATATPPCFASRSIN